MKNPFKDVEHLNTKINSPKIRKFWKRMMAKARRQDGKVNKDDALKTNRYGGWIT